MAEKWLIQQEQEGRWVTLQTRDSEADARTGAQALRSLMQMGKTPDAAVRIVPANEA